jgi:hypothetical protein
MIITPIEKKHCEQAKNVILSGFLERFGFIDHTLNPDIHDIKGEYDGTQHHFFIGKENDEIICTGAIRKETRDTYQIVRMSYFHIENAVSAASCSCIWKKKHFPLVLAISSLKPTNTGWTPSDFTKTTDTIIRKKMRFHVISRRKFHCEIPFNLILIGV